MMRSWTMIARVLHKSSFSLVFSPESVEVLDVSHYQATLLVFEVESLLLFRLTVAKY